MIRTLLVVLFLALYILIAGPPAILHCLATGSPELLFRVGVRGARWAMVLSGVRTRVSGIENIPSGPCVFVANHCSNLDPPAVVTSIPRRVAMLGKKEVFRIPLLGRALLLAQFVPVDRADRAAALSSVEQGLKHLRHGVSYLVFPEGTRSPDGRMRPFKKGSFVMALRSGAPIVPVSVVGAHRLMPKGSFVLTPGVVGVHFGPLIRVDGYSMEQREDLIGAVEEAVARHLPEDQQPRPSTSAPA